MQPTMLIDDNGDTWPVGSPVLRRALICSDPDLDVAGYAVRNLGFVLLRPQGRVLRAEMRPSIVRPATLIALYYNLLDLKPQRILLERLSEKGATHELFDDVSEFVATVERDIDDEGVQRHRPAYALSPRSLQQLRRARYARFAPAFELWRRSNGRLPRDLVRFLRDYGLHVRAALSRNPPGTERLVYEHIGSGYSFIRKACQPLLLVGKDIEMLPDQQYGGWATRSYYECLRDQEPRLETVSAVMQSGEGQRLWSYYDRVLLPWRTAEGTRFVLGLSEVRRRALAA